MPTYQYACTVCGQELEAVQSFSDAALTKCPECGGALRKVFSAVGVVFKGSGFYKTDSRSSSGSSSSSGGSSGDTGSSSTGTATTTGTSTGAGSSTSTGSASSSTSTT